jgi:2-polyprenyl-6-methoxyphenol hydroxylase-like FAD-dependent oxidoreductase
VGDPFLSFAHIGSHWDEHLDLMDLKEGLSNRGRKNSTVREALGLEFAGKTFDLRFLLADVHAESSLSDCEAHIFGRDQGLLAVFPLGHGRHRLIADNPPEHFGSETRPSLEEWQEVVNARARVPVRLKGTKST